MVKHINRLGDRPSGRWLSIYSPSEKLIRTLRADNDNNDVTIDNWGFKYYVSNTESGSVASNPNVWQCAATTEPKIVLFNTTNGDLKTSIGAVVASNQWYWASNVLYVYSTSDPATAFTAPGIQCGYRDFGIFANGKTYITAQNIDVIGANTTGVVAYGGATGFIGNNLTAYSNVIGYSNANETATFNNCIAHDNTNIGFWMGAAGGGTTIVNHCTSYNNANIGFGNASGGTLTCNYCLSYNNGSLAYLGVGGGFASHDACILNLNYCIAYNNWKAGISSVSTGAHTLYNNVFYNNKNALAPTHGYGINLRITGNGSLTVKNNIVYGNNVDLYTDISGTFSFTSDYNCWNVGSSSTLLVYQTTAYNFTNYKTASSQDAHSLNEDPLFISTSNFHLQAGSPTINAGVDVGLTEDYEGNPIVGIPDISAYEYN
jgi:hypothetical protein